MNQYKKLATDTVFIAIGSFSSKLLNFLFIPIYTSLLTTSDYGIADIIFTSSTLVYSLLTVSIGEAVMRFSLDKDAKHGNILAIGLLIALCGIVVIWAIFPLVSLINIRSDLYLCFSIFYTASTLYNILSFYARGIGNVKLFSVCGALSTFLIVISSIFLLVIFNCGLYGYVVSYSIGYGVAALLLFLISKAWVSLCKAKIEKKTFLSMVRYSFPLIPNSISWWLSGSANLYIIMFLCGSSQAGLFSAAQKIPSIITSIVDIFMTAWKISSVEDFGSENSRKFFGEVYISLMAFGSITCSIIILLAPIISSFLLSGDFYSAWIYVPILVIASLFNSTSTFFGSVYLAAKDTRILFSSTLIGALFSLFLGIILVSIVGVMGAAFAILAGNIITWLIRSTKSRLLLKFSENDYRELFVLVILLVQGILVISAISLGTLLSVVCLLAIVVLYRKALADILHAIFKFIKSRRL